MISGHLLRKNLKSPPLFPETNNIIPFDLTHLQRIKLQTVKAKQSLHHLESTFKIFNNALNAENKKSSSNNKGILRQYLWFRKLYDQVVLTSLMNMPLKDEIINSLSNIILQKEKRDRKKQNKIEKRVDQKDIVVNEDEEKRINKMSNSYVRMDFSKTTSSLNFSKFGSIKMNSVDQRANRKNRLYGSENVSRKTTVFVSNKNQSDSKSLNNSKLMWSWGLNQKCKQFSNHIECSSLNMHVKAIKQSDKLIQRSYVSKQRQYPQTQLKRMPRLNNIRVGTKQLKQIQFQNLLF